MKLVEVALQNFRAYQARTELKVGDLTAIVGKNDVGKSSILEALAIVMSDDPPKIDISDANVRGSIGDVVFVECAFSGLPASLTLDAGSTTDLGSEYLVDASGYLRLRWSWPIEGDATTRRLGRQSCHAIANHPSASGVESLHDLKNKDLKKIVDERQIAANCDLDNNASMRAAIWDHAEANGGLSLKERPLLLGKEDGKSILDQVRSVLPRYVLFRADRPSTDQDAEVQDPMKEAVRTALDGLQTEIGQLKQKVKEKALEVAARTLGKLHEFDSALANSLNPAFVEPKLEREFKLSLIGDDGIAVNKRGSGVRRLVLFSFFRAEAERRHRDDEARAIIYAVEEPETAQHPNFQRMVVDALQAMAVQDGCQVLLTTHSPALAGLLPIGSLRLLTSSGAGITVTSGTAACAGIASTLGVIPDHRVRVLVCVEGPNDRCFLQLACRAYRAAGEEIVCLTSDPSVAFVLLGGSTLGVWVSQNLLGGIGVPEYHLYDNDVATYGQSVADVNARGTQDSARLMSRRTIENYLSPSVIEAVLRPHAPNLGAVAFGPHDNVENVVASAMPDPNGNPRRRLDKRSLKAWLNDDVARAMSAADYLAQDPAQEVLGWLKEITVLARRA